eukprot:TRINITY_DN6079_c0_g1_i2.p1 TRINITY_DN6079_c0_g1~~TRINITY_DN6079_c0_g1_i2.p1  ORF type:complete len:163 (-),score=39.29 TRINITY_DN6079_c0_g1_i2:77-496(-)
MAEVEKGSCLCGAIHIEISAKPIAVANCYCTICQKSGGGFCSVNIGVPASALKVTQGQPKVYCPTGDSGKKVNRYFCGDCGSPLYSIAEVAPEIAYAKTPLFDNAKNFAPQVDIYVKSALPGSFNSDRPKFETMPPRNN